MNCSLYIHIPFCKKKCDYCDFFSIGEPTRKGKCNDLTDSYIVSLLNEARFYADFYKIPAWETVYVGGGTPSLLSNAQIATLFSGLKKIAPFSERCELTFEMNPDDVSEEFLKTCSRVGIPRLSMGIQALDDKTLAYVNRGSSVKIILNALENLRKFWNGSLSVDFIAGLPSHTWKSFKNQFEILKKYQNIDHVSLYTLTVEENTPLAKKISDGSINFSYGKADKMWISGRNILEKLGFFQYEVSNFSKKGFESRHNQTYWKQKNYLGVGAGASSTIYDFEKKSALRWTNTFSIPAYERKFSAILRETSDTLNNASVIPSLDLNAELQNLPRTTEILDCKTLEFEFLMMGFRRLEGVCDTDFKNRFGKDLGSRIGADNSNGIFAQWKRKRLATTQKTKSGTFYALNKRGILLLNRFLEELL